MAYATVTLFSNKSATQATDFSFGMTLADVSAKIDEALPENAVISNIKLQFQCTTTTTGLTYVNVDTFVSLTNSDSHISSANVTRLLPVRYTTSDGPQTPDDVDVTTYFNSTDPYSARNTSYTRLSVYFDTTNIKTKTFTCNYLRLYITYDIPHSHSYTSKDTKAATCTSAGVRTYTCSCGDSYTESITALGHSFGTTTAAKSATCLAAGNSAYKKCSRCNLYFAGSAATNATGGKSDTSSFTIAKKSHSYTGAIKSDGNGKDATHSFKCVNGCNQYGGAVKHTWNSGVVTQPTATSRGYTTYTCTASGCGATYTDNYTYIVTFKSDSGTTLKTETVAHGSKPTPPTAPTKADTAQWKYTFDGWYDANGNKWTSSTTITAATTFTARYTSTVQKYTIRWYNYDNTLLETDTDVPYGTKPTYNGADPTKTGDAEHSYQFAGWNYDTENGITPTLGTTYIDITAQFREIDNTYKVTWVNDGVVIEEDEAVPYGNKPDYNGTTPTKASDAQYDYTFIGWSTSVTDPAKPESELETVKGDITYNAIYSATVKLYTIKVVLFDTESTDVVEYGRDFTIEAPDDVIGYKFVKWSDGVAVNPRTIKVTGEAIYQAVYERLPIPFKVNLDQATGVYIVPETEEIVIQFDGVSPALASTDLSVDGWNISVIDYPIDSKLSDYALYEYYPVTKLFVSKNNKTTRIW